MAILSNKQTHSPFCLSLSLHERLIFLPCPFLNPKTFNPSKFCLHNISLFSEMNLSIMTSLTPSGRNITKKKISMLSIFYLY